MFFIEPSALGLRTLCDAKLLKLKLWSAENNEYTILPEEFCSELQLQARQFYNNAVDQSMYLTEVSGTAAQAEDDTFAAHIARREARYRTLCNHRLICGFAWLGIFGGPFPLLRISQSEHV